MLDTNICIYIRQKRPPSVLKRFEKLSVDDAAICRSSPMASFCTMSEKSADRAARLRQLAELASLLPVLPLPENGGETYGAIRAALERSADHRQQRSWIAAHAKAAALTLVTNNVGEFKRVPGLKVENWAA